MRNENEAQVFLEQVEKVDAIIPNKLIEIQEWDDIATSITAAMNGVCVQSSGSKQKMADAVNQCLDIIDELKSQVIQLRAVKKEVIQTIEKLYSAIEYDVLHMRYIQHKTLQEIADRYGRDYEWAKLTCKRGRNHVQVILNKRVRNDPK